ncbi:MAG: tRNA (N(6)-L-threonylcarbamoyladenosine(37)-C(2))-methylthiotransferase MtaB [Bacteroidales bacterium]|nr:tRNA (N(6)-L-threonylcarbamoyladenosine(37)-C(2))-methylthiotransferase MtaB [Bacteroides sp.]MCM1198521.1 tRNA (N(6)-L-threonylcarbamoyladenosine(37)-C(2))-methylthiotransferase MtaB [Clostridium sp.]MCM1503271.1 tRNA (N(6)-L-threonylcarbamoyladenosine(37)-C(2))-methylthiotransferase MtaB [Bacteroidales bacterium]
MKISFTTLGCKLNYAETSTYERKFIAEGLEVVPWTQQADICLVNTCSVTEHSDKKCRNIIRKLHRICPDAAIVVTGCYAQLKRQEIEAIDGVRFVFGANEKSEVVPTVMAYLSGDEDCRRKEGEFFAAYSSGERTRSFLKVQDGCDFKCAYCTVPYARGDSRNIPISEAVAQAKSIAAEGIREIVITGVNTGDFGKTTGETFLDLIKALNGVEGIGRYRISSIEPNLLTEETVDWIASGTKFLPHFHIPLQSGCDTVLKEMGRRYDTASFEHKINYIREKMERPGGPKVFFGIDVIVGFPGETDELFMETYNFLKDRIRPAFIHIFPYSRRAGTPAAVRKDQIQDSVKTERVEKLEALCRELNEDFVKSNEGVAEKVLFESSDRNGKMFGYTGNYIRIERPYDADAVGQVMDIII